MYGVCTTRKRLVARASTGSVRICPSDAFHSTHVLLDGLFGSTGMFFSPAERPSRGVQGKLLDELDEDLEGVRARLGAVQ
eukprot:8689542-Pyramimonas_sp.AAC.1